MSDEHFRTIYWPTLRKVLLGIIDAGLMPLLFAEGKYDSRLEVIQDLPKGTTVWRFDQTDLALAKRPSAKSPAYRGTCRSRCCTPVSGRGRRYTRKMIDAAGEGGGYIVDLGASLDDGRPENLQAMVEIAREYGVY